MNAVVAAIGHPHIASGVKGHTDGPAKLAGTLAQTAYLGLKMAGAIKRLEPIVVGIGHPENVFWADQHS